MRKLRSKTVASVDNTEEPEEKRGKIKKTATAEQTEKKSSESRSKDASRQHGTSGNSITSTTLKSKNSKGQLKSKPKVTVSLKTMKPVKIQQQATEIQTFPEATNEDQMETETRTNKVVDSSTVELSSPHNASKVNNRSTDRQLNNLILQSLKANRENFEEPQNNGTSMDIKQVEGNADIICGNGIRIKIRPIGVAIITPSNEQIVVKPDYTSMETEGCQLDVKDGTVSIKSDGLDSIFKFTK